MAHCGLLLVSSSRRYFNMSGTYFEERCRAYLAAPFDSERDALQYHIPLREWSAYCKAFDRKGTYRTALPVSNVQAIREASLDCCAVTGSASAAREMLLSTVPVELAAVDAVVNAANESLLGGGGVDAAIHNGAGPMLVRECATLGGCDVAEAKVTKGYDLPATYVVHTVGPILSGRGAKPQPAALAACYVASLERAEELGLESVMFPCISCGFYGFPVGLSAETVLPVVADFLRARARSVRTVVFSLFSEEQRAAYRGKVAAMTAAGELAPAAAIGTTAAAAASAAAGGAGAAGGDVEGAALSAAVSREPAGPATA